MSVAFGCIDLMLLLLAIHSTMAASNLAQQGMLGYKIK